MLSLHNVALDDIESPMALHKKLSFACSESDSYTIKTNFFKVTNSHGLYLE